MNIFNTSNFIMISEPIRTKTKDEDIKKIYTKINNGLKDELNEQEVINILDFIVEEIRKKLDIYLEEPVETNPLHGLCGITQYMSLKPLNDCKFDITINNINKFLYDEIRHSFGTCTFKIKKENEIIKKRYLIDLTYRQFFTKARCDKKIQEPDPGYFICDRRNSYEMLKWTKELLKKGYANIDNNEFIYYMKGFTYYVFYKKHHRLPNTDEMIVLHNYCVEQQNLIKQYSQEKFNKDDMQKVLYNDLNIITPKIKRR